MVDIMEKMIGWGLGMYIIAYVVTDAIVAIANTTIPAGIPTAVDNALTTVIPVLAAILTVYIMYKAGKGGK